MRRVWIIWIVMGIMFAGCAEKQNTVERAMEFRQTLLNREGCSFFAYITADLGDMTYDFTLDCSMDRNGGIRFEVVEPQSIAGVTGEVDHQGGNLTFDDKILAIPMIVQGQISPVCAPYLLCRSLRGGYIKACGRDEQGYRITMEDSFRGEMIRMEVWLDEEDHPAFGEVYWQDRRLLSVRFADFRFV